MSLWFPNNNNGSRVVVTTRLSNVAAQFCSSNFKMNFLDGDKSWELFCRTTFLEEGCPLELVGIGKEIVKKCKGLPLSIVVIGAFLGKSSRRKEYWRTVVREINSILKSDEDELCLNLLALSYNHLPAHLKPCFLYMGILQEDQEIHVSRLINLFVAEGFLKRYKTQTLEETAQDYLKDLVDRNLILVSKKRWDGAAKSYRTHDLIRELCLREAEKEKFLHVTRSMLDISVGVGKDIRRIAFHNNKTKGPRVLGAFPSAEPVRTLIQNGGPMLFKSLLLKVLTRVDTDSLESVFQQVNLRYLEYYISKQSVVLPSSASLLWNLQTLIIVAKNRTRAPSEIWYMGQLRHIEVYEVCLPDPPIVLKEECVVKNLQSLGNVVNFNFRWYVWRRFPNIVKLHISYDDSSSNILSMDLHSLHNLQSLKCCLYNPRKGEYHMLENLFPRSIKKLSLDGWNLSWKKRDTTWDEVASSRSSQTWFGEWNVEEGAFPRLKYLRIGYSSLMHWNADASHFPVLEKLDLRYLHKLVEIPLDIGDIPTLRYLNLTGCSESAAISSTEILKEQLSVGNEDIEVEVDVFGKEEEKRLKEIAELENFPIKNFHCISGILSLTQKIRQNQRALWAAQSFLEAASKKSGKI